MGKMGMRKGRRLAIHTFGEVASVAGAKPFRTEIFKTFSSEPLCTVISDRAVGEGLVYIAIAPAGGNGGPAMTLAKLEKKGNQLTAEFESKGPIKEARITLDDRGRARNLEEGKDYLFNVFSKRQFFDRYEKRSIPVGKGKRSEPDETGAERIANFLELADVGKGDMVLDTATGIKEYLRHFSKLGARLTCLNISPSILKKTREWLGDENANFVAYDIEEGIPFAYHSFDVVICDALLEYVADCHEAIAHASSLVKRGGSLLLLEPVKSTVKDFYPQDLFEIALWRPRHDPLFNKRCMEETLRARKFKLVESREMRFSYPIFEKEEFCQSIAKFEKHG
jgi:ubiquinone/menaquinone biosynthesis C-methylase UbiE